MKTHTIHPKWALAPLLLAPMFSLQGQESEKSSRVLTLEDPQRYRCNRISIGYNAGFNISADFSRLGARTGPPPGLSPGPAAGGAVDRFYDDGFVRVDSTGNGAGVTWFWGYENPAQYTGDAIEMHSTSSLGGSSKDNEDDPQHGIQIIWNRELGTSERETCRWGLELSFGWNNIEIEDGGSVAGATRVITDSYSIGYVPPDAPYSGTFGGPGPTLPSSPSREVTRNASGALITGTRNFEADLFVLHLGPYIEFPVVQKLRGMLSAGAAVALMDGSFNFNEATTIGGGPATRTRGSDDHAEVLYGAFVSATLLYPIAPHWSVFAGAQFQTLTDYEITAAGRKADIDLSATPFATVGISYTF